MAGSSENLNQPLPYVDWVQAADVSISSEIVLFEQYNEYVTQWYSDNSSDTADNQSQVVNAYKDILKEITLNYSTDDEKRFLSNLDYDDPRELDIIVPYFAKKLKQITQYIVRKREDVKATTVQNSMRGSDMGTTSIIKHKIISLLADSDFTEKYPNSYIPPVSSTAKSMNVRIEPLYDIYQHYYDTDPDVSGSLYDPKADALRISQLNSNNNSKDHNAWLNLTQAIENIFAEIPLLLATECDSIASSDGLSLQFTSERNDFNDLPESYFIGGEISEENLIITYQKQLSEKYAGTKMVYLSTGSTATTYVSGELFDPQHPTANLLNRYHSSHATVPCSTEVRTIQDIGGFFTPSKLGITNYNTLESYYEIDKSKLQPNTVYVLPDPSHYGAGRGNTMADQPKIFTHHDDVRLIKASRSSNKLQGDIVNDEQVQKHYPYQSREETLRLQTQGISRYHDNIDFWTGDTHNVWSNSDIYSIIPLSPLPVDARNDDLLISNLVIDEWKTDLFGNEYGLYKDTHAHRKTSLQTANGNLSSSVTQNTSTRTSNVTGDLFSEYSPNYYDYKLSSFNTIEEASTSSTTNSSLYDRKAAQQTRFYFRDRYSTLISPVSSALSGVYVKYNQSTDILNEVRDNVRRFDIIKDVIIIETPNFIVIERVDQDITTGKYSSNLEKQTYISLSGTNSNFEQFGNWWYDESDNCILFNTSVIHPYLSGSNYKVIYPIIHRFNLQTHKLTQPFSLKTVSSSTDNTTTYAALTSIGLSLTDTGEEINITSIDRPSISYNKQDRTYSVSFLGKSINAESYLHNFYLTTSNKERFEMKSADIFRLYENTLHYNVHNFSVNNVTGEPSLSANLEGELQRGGTEETFKFSSTGWSSQVDIPGTRDLPSSYISFGGLSGRSNPVIDRVIDTTRNTTLLCQGLSSSLTQISDNTVTAPYTHNNAYIVSNVALSAARDITVCLDVAFYTNTTSNSAYAMLSNASPALSSFSGTERPGEGLSVFFFDSAHEIFPAGIGSALGYANYNGPMFSNAGVSNHTSINGIRGGYIGVGFDIKGDFGNLTSGKTGDIVSLHPQASAYPYMDQLTCTTSQSTSALAKPNTLTVRASELSGYKVISTTDNLSSYPISGHARYSSSPTVTLHEYVSSADDATFHKLRVSLLNSSSRLSVEIYNTTDSKFYPYQVIDLDGTDIPETLRSGVAFSTSHAFMTCEIKNVGVYGYAEDYAKNVANLAPLSGAAFTVATTS